MSEEMMKQDRFRGKEKINKIDVARDILTGRGGEETQQLRQQRGQQGYRPRPSDQEGIRRGRSDHSQARGRFF